MVPPNSRKLKPFLFYLALAAVGSMVSGRVFGEFYQAREAKIPALERVGDLCSIRALLDPRPWIDFAALARNRTSDCNAGKPVILSFE